MQHRTRASIDPLGPRRPEGFEAFIRATIRLGLVLAAYFFVFPALLLASAWRLAPYLPALPDHPLVRWTGLAVAIAGGYLFVRAWLILATMGKEWPRRRTVLLVTDHIYSFVRHPLYLGYSCVWIGWALWRSSAGLLLVSTGASLGLLLYVLAVEEPRLASRFGRKYAEYRRRVPLLRPRWMELTRGALALNLFLLTTLIVFRWLFRFIWRIKVEGQEYVPENGSFLLVSNHVNLADPFLIGLFLTRRVNFMASDELFRKPLFRLLFSKLWPAFPKRRWGRDVGALRHAQRALARGEPVGIFPEGARNWDGGPVSVGDEVYRFIHHCRAPVLTATIIGGHEAMPRWACWPSFARVTIRFFPPIEPGTVASAGEMRALIEPRIFACSLEAPVPRTIWRSHRGLPTVVWGCIKCSTPRSMTPTEAGLRCRACGAAWQVTPRLELIDEETGEKLLEREYHAMLKAGLAAGEVKGGLVAWSQVKAYRVVDGPPVLLGRGELVIDSQNLTYDDGKSILRMAVPEIGYAFLNLRNHLVVSDRVQVLEFKILSDSPVRIEDYLGTARMKQMQLWRPGEVMLQGRGR